MGCSFPKQFTVTSSQFFLKMCPPCVSLLVSALFRWLCSIFSFVSQVCHCWCPLFSAGPVAFLFICLPGLSLLVAALFRWPCSVSMHLSPKSVAAGVHPFPVMQHFYSCISQVCHWWCPPFSAGDATFLFMSPRSVTGGVRPFPLAM